MADEDTAPSYENVSRHVIPTERIGALNVWVQGDLSLAQNKESRDSCCVFLTVHDVNANHNAWLRFANTPFMAQIREKSVFLHVDLLGQEEGAEDITEAFPTLQEIGEDLVNILDHLRIKCVIGLGEGAGANIMLRFGAMHVTRCLGIVCINPNEVAPSILDGLVERLKSLTGKDTNEDQEHMNQKNVAKFLGSYMNRSDVLPIVEKSLNSETLLVAGSKAENQIKGMEAIFSICDKAKTSMLKIDDVANVMDEAPGKLANSILLFAKGLGWLTSLNLPNVERRSSKDSTGRRMSMQDYDQPNIRRLSLTGSSGNN